MKFIARFLAIALLSLLPTMAIAQNLANFTPGVRMVDGGQLNLMVAAINNMAGGGTPGPGTFTTLTVSSTLAVTGVATFTAIPIAPATGIRIGATTFSEATLGLYSKGVAAGYKIARGETALDGTNPTPVASGLATIVSCSLTIKQTSAPGVGTSVLTYDTSTSTLNMYGWKVTGAGDTTLIASTGTETIGWVCVGT